MSVPIGIDLGTSTSEVAAFRNGEPEFLRDIRNSRSGVLPSAVALGPGDDLIVGARAERTIGAVRQVKRAMGTEETFTLGDKSYRPEEISARILRHLKENAERILGTEITEAVITVPADFKDRKRQATIDAGELAGLRVERIINEPTAAALAYGLNELENDQHVLVFDLGGGTFDVSVLEMFQGILEVKASAGEGRLGGIDFDERIVQIIAKDLERQTGVKLLGDEGSREKRALQQVREAAEQAKIELSSQDAAVIDIPYVGNQSSGFQMVLNRREFELATRDLVERTGVCIENALQDAKLDKSEIDVVILVGGATRIPAVREFVSNYFDGRALPERVPPDEAVALGASIQAALKDGTIDSTDGLLVTDVTAHSLGVATLAYEAGMMLPDRMSVHIPRQTTIPVEESQEYRTVHDGQSSVMVRIYQGESQDVANNDLLDQFTLTGIPAAPAGEESVEIRFGLDVNAVLRVTATVSSTGERAEVEVKPSDARMTEEEKTAASKELQDQWKHSSFYKRVEPLLASAERNADQLEGEQKEKLQGIISSLKTALADEDEEAVDRLDMELTDILFELQ